MELDNIIDRTRRSLNKNENAGQELTVNVEMLGVLMNNLSNLYQDPAAGAFRETLSNAIDSHINLANNREDFVEISLPDFNTNSIIKIQDFGVGMSRETLVQNFLSYGSSTKSGNNETGGFGYGGKSPLAVADSFTVVSVKDGLRNSFTVSKDPEDTLVAPKFEWDEDCADGPVETTEPNGVTVTYRVEPKHMRNSFTRTYEMTDWRPSELALLGVPNNCVKIDGEIVKQTVHNPELFEPVLFNGQTVGWVGKNAEMFENSDDISRNELYVHVGNVVYRISSESVFIENAYNLRMWKTPFVLNAPIGTLDVTPSRDELRYTTKTVETLQQIAAEFTESVNSSAQTAINRAETMTEAAVIVADLIAECFPIAQNFTYRDNGDVKKVLDSLSEEIGHSLRNKKPHLVVHTRITTNSGSKKRSSNAFSERSNWSTIFKTMQEKPVYITSTPALNPYAQVTRNLDVLEQFGNQKARHQDMEKDDVLIVSQDFVNTNEWTKQFFSGVETIEEALKTARAARAEYNKKHGITATQTRAVHTGPRKVKVAFVTISFDPTNKEKYVLTPHHYLSSGQSIGSHYAYTVGSHEKPYYSVSDYRADKVGSGDISSLHYQLVLTMHKAEEEGRKVVLRTSRQPFMNFPNGVRLTRSDLMLFARERAVSIPSLTKEEIRAILIQGDNRGSNIEHSGFIYLNSDMTRSNYAFNSLPRNLRHNLENLTRFAETYGTEIPADLAEYVNHFSEAENVLKRSAVNEWCEIQRSDIFTNTAYKLHELGNAENIEQYKETVEAVQTEISDLCSKHSLLFLGLSMVKYGNEVDKFTSIYADQVRAMLDSVE